MENIEVIQYHLTGVKHPSLKIIGLYNENLNFSLLGDQKKLKYQLNVNEDKKTFVLTALVNDIKEITLIDNSVNQVVLQIKNRKYKRIIKKIKSVLLNMFTVQILEENDFIGIQSIHIGGINHPVVEISGSIIKDHFEFYLVKNNQEKILLHPFINEHNFVIRQEVDKKDKNLSLIVKVDNKEYFVAKIKNRLGTRIIQKIKSIPSSYYKIHYNDQIEFSSIELSGIIHPQCSISGNLKNKDAKISFQCNDKTLEAKQKPVMEENEFYYYVNLSKNDHKIKIYLDKQLVLEVSNGLFIRIFNKIFAIIKKFINRVGHFFYVIYRGIRAAWKQYHFLIPPRLWKKYWLEFINKLQSSENSLFYNPDNIKDYHKWIKEFEKEEEYVDLKYQPLISILIPIYNVSSHYLSACLDSILNQSYSHFEICLVDDASTNKDTINTLKEYEKKDNRIKVKYRKKNGHISNASNDALKLATGEFIGLVDDDDILTENALYEVVKVLNQNKKLDFIYSDEDKLNEKEERCYPHFKSDFAPDTLMSINYICHFSVLRKKVVEQVGGFEVGLEGAQDHDLFLKVSEVTDRIYHIPKILYHWRMIEGSTAADLANKNYANDKGKISIEHALKRRKLAGEVTIDKCGYYIVNYKLKKEPLISIIIPTKDYSNILDKCLKSLYEKTTYKNFEVIVVNNNSVEKKTFQLFESYQQKYDNFRVVDANMEFNYSKINNLAVNQAKGEYIVLLNNDTEIITPNWLEIMVGYASLPHIGAVGVKLLYPDNTVQHGGVILGLGGVASHAYIGVNRKYVGSYGRLRVPYNYSAVTAACLMIKKTKFDEVKGLDETLKVAYNDIDFNLKLIQKGYYNIFLPQVELYHHESKSRGYDTTTDKYKRFVQEQEYMYKKWPEEIAFDKMYNVNFSKKGWFVLDKNKKGGKL